jgi:hypothetical protein
MEAEAPGCDGVIVARDYRGFSFCESTHLPALVKVHRLQTCVRHVAHAIH